MFEYVAGSTKGKRDYQEDCFGFLELGGDGESSRTLVCVVADGMGGHVGGAAASSAVVNTFLSAYARAFGDKEDPLHVALQEAVAAVAGCEEASPELHGMGSTLVAVVCTDAGVEWLSVGDSPLWMLRGGILHRLNVDHSMKPVLDRMAETGQISREEATSDPQRHHLRSAITKNPPELVDRSADGPVPLQRGDALLLASDGVLTLAEREISAVLTTPSDQSDLPTRLLDAVTAKGLASQDNTTVVIVRRRETEARPAPRDRLREQQGGSESSGALPPSKATPSPRPRGVVAALAGAIVVVPLLAWLLWPGEPPSGKTDAVVAAARIAEVTQNHPAETGAASESAERLRTQPLRRTEAETPPAAASNLGQRADMNAADSPAPAIGGDSGNSPGRPPPTPKLLSDEPPETAPSSPPVAAQPPREPPQPVAAPAATEKEGFLIVGSTPPGAAVYIDGKESGTAGNEKRRLPAGNHTIELRLDGYRDSERITVRLAAGGNEKRDISLCESRAKRACRDGSAWWFDGCNKPQELAQSCAGNEVCTEGACQATCSPRARRECIEGNFYNFDSCGAKDPVPHGKCGTPPPAPPVPCVGDACKPEKNDKNCGDRHSKKDCRDGDIWWFDECEKPTEVAEKCQGAKSCKFRGSFMCK